MPRRTAIPAEELLGKIRAYMHSPPGNDCADCEPLQLGPLRSIADSIN
jgi:hypothetical protein